VVEFIVWIVTGFISGSVPWSVIIGKLLIGKDVRMVGDGNPGSANSWKLGGWVPGILSFILDTGKGIIPVYFAAHYLNLSSINGWSDPINQFGFAVIAAAPVAGHAWSPFLKFKGGKALATTWGSWIAITGGLAFPVGCLLLSLGHGLQKNHAITVTFVLASFLPVFLALQFHPYILIFWVFNILVVIYKHRSEYSHGVIRRSWIDKASKRKT